MSTCASAVQWWGNVVTSRLGVWADTALVTSEQSARAYGINGGVTALEVMDAAGAVRGKWTRTLDHRGATIRQNKFTNSSASPSYLRDVYRDLLGRARGVADERNALLGAEHAANEARVNERIEHDKLDRVTSVTRGIGTAAQATTTYTYDAHGNLATVTDGDTRVTRYLYDDFGRLVQVLSPDTGETRYVYNDAGRLVQQRDAEGNLTVYAYDASGRLAAEVFDGGGGSGDDRYFYYDDIDPGLSGATTGSHVCPQGTVQFDPANLTGRLAWVRHAAGATYYRYSMFGEMTAVYEQSGAVFDACALLITRYAYDGSGRLAEATYPSGRRVSFVRNTSDLYPVAIELLEPDGFGGTLTSVLADNIVYDVRGNVVGFASGSASFSGAFDLAGQALSREYDIGGMSAFAWDTSDRDGNGNILSATDTVAGKDLSLTYDGQDRLASAQGTILRGYQDCSYLYDAAGNRTTESCYGHPVTYDYETTAQAEPTNRLGALSWLADDLNACGGPDVTVTRDYDVDVLGRASTGYRRKYPLASEAFTMTYSPSGRLAAVVTPSGAYNYNYDHRNLRVTKDGPGVAVRFTYDQSGRLQVEQDNTGATKEYVYLGGEPLAMLVDDDGDALTQSATYLLGTDHLGTPMRAWDASGNVSWAADYEAFGKAWEYLPGTTASPSIDVPLRFPGQYEDQETGLHYNWWRYYDPSTGRYTTADPYGQFGEEAFAARIIQLRPKSLGQPSDVDLARTLPNHVYSYVASNPTRFVDVTGLEPPAKCEDCDQAQDFCEMACNMNPEFDPFADPNWWEWTSSDPRAQCHRRCVEYGETCRRQYCQTPVDPCAN